jgi:uncharacterized membrane-anchored protein YhcB (DUF1043 family)
MKPLSYFILGLSIGALVTVVTMRKIENHKIKQLQNELKTATETLDLAAQKLSQCVSMSEIIMNLQSKEIQKNARHYSGMYYRIGPTEK